MPALFLGVVENTPVKAFVEPVECQNDTGLTEFSALGRDDEGLLFHVWSGNYFQMVNQVP